MSNDIAAHFHIYLT